MATSFSLADGGVINFSDNGEIKSYDNNHKIIFDRSNDQLIYQEYGNHSGIRDIGIENAEFDCRQGDKN